MSLAALSAGAMLYVGLYQIRAVRRLWCPLSGGCEAVADAPFARPFGMPDGFIAFAPRRQRVLGRESRQPHRVALAEFAPGAPPRRPLQHGVDMAPGLIGRRREPPPPRLIFQRVHPGVDRDAPPPPGLLGVVGDLAKNMFMIMLQDFMDPWTFNQKNLMKCCKAFLLPGGGQVPFCAYNTVGYREQARAQLDAMEPARRAARREGKRYEPRPIVFDFPKWT